MHHNTTTFTHLAGEENVKLLVGRVPWQPPRRSNTSITPVPFESWPSTIYAAEKHSSRHKNTIVASLIPSFAEILILERESALATCQFLIGQSN